jgi:RNA polymerase sigma-70 factor (ECF subfamily)
VDDLTFLALAARDGDRAALERFVRTALPDIWRVCAYLGDHDRADDLTQETFVRVIGALPAFRGEAAARTWMLSIARRACADEVRRAQRRRKLFTRLTAMQATDEQPPDHAVDLDDVIRDLPETRRDAFVLTQLLGLSYEEAAEICGCPVGTIRSRVSRARADLVAATSESARPTGLSRGTDRTWSVPRDKTSE